MKSLQRFALLVIAAVGISRAEGVLYLLSGTPTPASWSTKYALDLLRLEDDAVAQVTRIVPENIGSHWVGFSYDAGLAAIWASNDDIIVIDLVTGTVAKQCHLAVPQNSLIDQWMVDVPGKGLMLDGLLVTDDPAHPFVRGMILDPKVACNGSSTPAVTQDLRFLVAHGTAGVGDTNNFEGISASRITVDNEGNVKLRFDDEQFPGLRLPGGEARKGVGMWIGVFATNSKLKVISLSPDGNPPVQFLALRNRDNTWHKLPASAQSTECVRTFGSYVAIAESVGRESIFDQRRRNRSGVTVLPQSETKEFSAGKSEWRRQSVPRGPDTDTMFDASMFTFPGRLHLFDVETDRVYTIKTNQGDSEILLVEDNRVYYRVTNRLYSAPIEESRLGPATLLATDEAIRDAHWAFLTR